MAKLDRKQVISKLRGALPRYSRSDDADTPVVLETQDVNNAIRILEGEAK